MKKIRVGIVGTADIAFRRFLPALSKMKEIEYIGVASRDISKTEKFVQKFGGRGFGSYEELIQSEEVEAIYMPLPPALHYTWGKKVLENNKHLLLEKPFTTNTEETKQLIELAKVRGLALHENYMFQYHKQLEVIKKLLKQGYIGEIRQLRIAFGFPKRLASDFRYNKDLGGGALLDCGGYPIKLASLLLGEHLKVVTSVLNYGKSSEVDLYGSATIINERDEVVQLAFGMDNAYKCELEVWGSKGILIAPRIFTAPADYPVVINCKQGNEEGKIDVGIDDQFLNSINYFCDCIKDDEKCTLNYKAIYEQARLMEAVRQFSAQIK